MAIAKGYGCGAATVRRKADLEAAYREMIQYPGPFVLDVQVPYQEHVLPMIPSGKTVDDMILPVVRKTLLRITRKSQVKVA